MRTVLITGTSTGFGLVTAVELAKRGWRVFATMRNPAKSGALEAALGRAGAGVRERVTIGQLDVTSEESVRAAVAATLAATGGRLDAVVHNAGVAAGGAFEDMPEAELRRVMDTNFFGVLALTRALLPTFRAQRSGRILIVSSEFGFTGQPANSIYCASKWAIEGWAEFDRLRGRAVRHRGRAGRAGPLHHRYLGRLAAHQPRGQRLPRLGAVHVPRRRRARRGARARPAGGGGEDRHRARGAPPGFRNPVGRLARITHFLRGKLPSRLMRKGVERYLGLHRVRP